MKTSVIIGMMSEIAMKAKILRNRLKKSPEMVVEILKDIERLEEEMLLCVVNFERQIDR